MKEEKIQPNKPSGMVDLPKVGQVEEKSKVGTADIRQDISDSLAKSLERARDKKQEKLRLERQEKASSAGPDVFAQSKHYGKIKTKKFRKALAPLHAKFFRHNSVERFQAKDPVKWKKLFQEKYPELAGKKYLDRKDVRILKKKWQKDLRKGSLLYSEKDRIRRQLKALEGVSTLNQPSQTKKTTTLNKTKSDGKKKSFLKYLADIGKSA